MGDTCELTRFWERWRSRLLPRAPREPHRGPENSAAHPHCAGAGPGSPTASVAPAVPRRIPPGANSRAGPRSPPTGTVREHCARARGTARMLRTSANRHAGGPGPIADRRMWVGGWMALVPRTRRNVLQVRGSVRVRTLPGLGSSVSVLSRVRLGAAR